MLNSHQVTLPIFILNVEVQQNYSQAELAAEDLRQAVQSIGRILGRIDVEDILDVLFADFCIGK